jgi:hypothetical protein
MAVVHDAGGQAIGRVAFPMRRNAEHGLSHEFVLSACGRGCATEAAEAVPVGAGRIALAPR